MQLKWLVTFFAWLAIAIFHLIALPGNAHARALQLSEQTCTANADSIETGLSYTRAQLQCSGDRFGLNGRYVRTSTRLDSPILPLASGLVWQTEASDFRSMIVRFSYADGSSSMVDVDPQMGVRNWFPGNRFSIPVPDNPSALAAIDTVVEKPVTRAITATARLVTRVDAERAHYYRSLCYMLVIGLLLIPLVYDVLFYRILRQNYVLWHLVMVVSMLAYTFLHSGLVFLVFPDMPLGLRWRAAMVSFVIALSSSVMVLRGLIEPKYLDQRTKLALAVAASIPIALKVVCLAFGEAFRITINPIILLAFIPAAFLVTAVVGIALAKGSRGAKWALFAFAPLIVAGFLRLMQGMDVIVLPFATEDAIFASLAMLAGVLSLGVGDRFLILKQDRDQARMHAVRLGQMANTDGLTGLANRRAFDLITVLQVGQGLIVADIDRFKAINDLHGHQVGDAVLCDVAMRLRHVLADFGDARIFRLGGEEFAIVARASDEAELMAISEAMRCAVAEERQALGKDGLPQVTVSLGAILGEGQLMHEAFAEADAALYGAKSGGRNVTVMAAARRPWRSDTTRVAANV